MWTDKEYSHDYLDEILEMTREHYGPENDISNRDFLQHQYFNNPSGNAVIDLAIDEENQIMAGQYVVWPMRMQVFECKRTVSNSLNTLTRAAYRGQGIFTGLAEKVYARETKMGHAFCYGVPNPNSYPGFIKKLSFHELGRIPLMLRPMKPSAMVKEFLHNDTLSYCAKVVNTFFKPRKPSVTDNLEIVVVSHENLSLVDSFWETVNGKYPVMNTRDAEFVRFRYLNMPKRDYYPYLALHGGVPVAFAVGRIMEVAGMQCAMLADFLFVDGYSSVAKKLLDKVLYDLHNMGACLAGCQMLTHTRENVILKQKGFFKCPKKIEPQPFPLILRLFDDSLKEAGIYNLENWFFTMGDYDVI